MRNGELILRELWESEIRANKEIIRWQREILEEERRQRPNEPALSKLIKEAMNGRVQKWFVDGSEYKDPDVFLYDIANGVKEIVDSVDRHEFVMCIGERGSKDWR